MREIKFRAYINDGGYKRVSEVGEIKFTNSISESYLVFDEYGTLLPKEQLDRIVQFIGLKDKNGVEIYEGDIIHKCHGEFSNGEKCFVKDLIEWDSKFARFTVPIFSFNDEGIEDLSFKETWEVIGNIHENPELLNKTERN